MAAYIFNNNFGKKYNRDFEKLKKEKFPHLHFVNNFNYPINNLTSRRLRYLQQTTHIIWMLDWIIKNNINSRYFMLLEDDFL
jgi:hypothetical protein